LKKDERIDFYHTLIASDWYNEVSNIITYELDELMATNQSDMHALLPVGLNWNFEEAYQFVVDNVISRLP
jgi:hypothetical protein